MNSRTINWLIERILNEMIEMRYFVDCKIKMPFVFHSDRDCINTEDWSVNRVLEDLDLEFLPAEFSPL